ncbi:ATP-binding protein [Variovorax paradoxus]|nr:ATP-binding protein [Variovorax paradoxus]MBT2305427.1 ATP-binding protein [Variovorax paradoxus]
MCALSTSSARPSPYVGIRAYTLEERANFFGRDADVAAVADLVADKTTWRVILLHGLSGVGKSSFLKAGLIPEVTSHVDTNVFRKLRDGVPAAFINSTAEPMERLAEAAMDLISQRLEGRASLFLESMDLPGNMAEARVVLAGSARLLSGFFQALAPEMNKPLLLVIDQAEELFTLRMSQRADEARTEFFDFLASFCGKESWIQILVSLRTEFYGRFDAELRQRLGSAMPVASYFLGPLAIGQLEHVILAPIEAQRELANLPEVAGPARASSITYEDGLARTIARDIVKTFPGPGALTCLQIVCARLYELAVVSSAFAQSPSASPSVIITTEMYKSLGPLELTIEDVVDQAIGRDCDQRKLSLRDALLYWHSTKRVLGALVNKNFEGTPVTSFMLRTAFEKQMLAELQREMRLIVRGSMTAWARVLKSGSDAGDIEKLTGDRQKMEASITKLIDFLLRPENRILRAIEVAERGTDEPALYLALGHDVLAVGLAEATTRSQTFDRMLKEDVRRSVRDLLLGTFAVVMTALIASLFVPELQKVRGEGFMDNIVFLLWTALIGSYVVLLLIGLKEAYHNVRVRRWLGLITALRGYHAEIIGSAEKLGWMATMRSMFTNLPHMGRLFRRVTEVERTRAMEGLSAFPGGLRY